MYKAGLLTIISFSVLLNGCRFNTEDEPPKGNYEFILNSYYMIADGKKQLVLRLFWFDEDSIGKEVIEEVHFYHEGELLDGNVFTTERDGLHTFVAIHGNWRSHDIAVIARKEKTYEPISIPVVFHIMYKDEPVGTGANLSIESLDSVLSITNHYFQRTYYSTYYPDI